MLQKNGRKNRETTNSIVIYRTNTDEKTNLTKHDVRKQQLDLGMLGLGYHYIVDLTGEIEKGIDIEAVGVESPTAICVCIVGGKTDKTKINKEQQISLDLIKQFVYQKYNFNLQEEYV
jgi:5-methylcytosine-specific restriction endonuclease McrBC GTP-binding regulatory subunit McrB|tara:strand:- start:1211 stop:1564 length:354 start_codon:yes stop_codon:yes gene_type:complete